MITVVGFLDGRAFPGELMSLFRLQYFAAGLVLGAAAALAGRRRIALFTVALAAINGFGLVPGLMGGARPDPARPQLRLLVANVWHPGTDYGPLIAEVERERPDVIGLTELTQEWAEGISATLGEYRYRVLRPLPGGYGIGLYSRVPLKGSYVGYPAGNWPPVIFATVAVGGRPVQLVVLHAPSSTGPHSAGRHRAFMRNLGTIVGAEGDATLVCGDLNAAPWTASYQELRDRGGLERDDPWRPFEWTYPVWNRLLRIPIDQCLAGSALSVASRTGSSIGSDHFPLVVDVGL